MPVSSRSMWKSGRVTLVYEEKGDKHAVKNYRPISLLGNVSKIFERIIYDQLYEYLTTNDLLNPNNSGQKKDTVL